MNAGNAVVLTAARGQGASLPWQGARPRSEGLAPHAAAKSLSPMPFPAPTGTPGPPVPRPSVSFSTPEGGTWLTRESARKVHGPNKRRALCFEMCFEPLETMPQVTAASLG